jgi:4-amino-4-deoxy-L-arabinose transferase-like glycosyltransferase
LGKGPLGVLLPGLILTCWHGWNREWRKLLQLAPLALVSLAIAVPWYLLLIHRLGADFVFNELYLQNFDRFGNTNRGHGEKGWYYYFKNMPPDIGIWCLALLPALWVGFRERRGDRNWRLLVLWLLAPLAFFTLASTKRNVYMLPVYPAIALLVADWLLRAENGWQLAWRTWAARGCAALVLLLGVVLMAAWLSWSHLPVHRRATPELMIALRPIAIILGLWLMIAGAWCLRESLRQQMRAWISLAAVLAVTWSGIMWLVLPAFDTVRTFQPAAHWIAERVPEQGLVGFHVPGRENPKRPAWLCHLGGRRLVFLSTSEEALAWLQVDSARLLISDPDRVPPIAGTTIVQSWMISGDTWTVLRADK